MKIVLDPMIMLKLETAVHTTGLEFSGFGFVEASLDEIFVYDIAILNVGTFGYTEIKPTVTLPLLSRPDVSKMHLWFHRHPLGNSVPGPHNWSAVDDRNVKETPLGGSPDTMKWSASIVRTPGGWVGRVDNYMTHKTVHCEVEPKCQDVIDLIHALAKQEVVSPDVDYTFTDCTLMTEDEEAASIMSDFMFPEDTLTRIGYTSKQLVELYDSTWSDMDFEDKINKKLKKAKVK